MDIPSGRFAERVRSVAPLLVAAALMLASAILFLDLADDVREGETDRFDRAVVEWVAHHRSPDTTACFRAVTALGSGPVLSLLTVGAATGFWLAGKPRAAVVLGVTMAGAGVLTSGLKAVFARDRPDAVLHLDTVDSGSFPSGHAIGAMAFCTTLALLVRRHVRRRGLRRFVAAAALALGALVAASRVYLGVHYPSDVAGGVLLGVSWSLAVVIAERIAAPRRRR